MTIVLEFNPADWLCFGMGIFCLVSALFYGIGYPSWARRRIQSPIALALTGASLILWTLLFDIDASAYPWFWGAGLLLCSALSIGAGWISGLERRGLPHNQSLQPTVDPAGSSADAEAPSASTASEPRR